MPSVHQIGSGTYFVRTELVNWVLLTEGESVTLIDTGYPGQHDALLESIRRIGHQPGDVEAVLITHAHVDHIGSAQWFHDTHGAPVFLHDREIPHARRESEHRVTARELMTNLWRPGVAPWLVRAVRTGATAKLHLDHPRAFPTDGPMDLPGRPVPVATPGHTPGHTVYHLPEEGIAITGDTLVTGHPASRTRGPQLLPAMFDDDRQRTVRALETVAELDADILLPGHGPLRQGPLSEAVALAGTRTPS